MTTSLSPNLPLRWRTFLKNAIKRERAVSIVRAASVVRTHC